MLSRLLLLSCLLTSSLLAQRGDKPGEEQPQPGEHIKIPPAPVLSADEALKTFTLAPGYRIELVAAEPLVGDPVAIAFGPDGRIWVAEMRSFMPNVDGHGEDAKIGCIAVLEDTDGDGLMDKRTVFLDGLVLPRALAIVGDGVLVAEPPHLWFCRDTNGDGVADEKTEVASDYGSTANVEHTANGLMPALDNWIYNANFSVRFRYEGGNKFARDLTITRGQWGISQDDTGRIYYNSNSDPLRADLVPSAYFNRNPAFASPAGIDVQLVPANLRVWPGRVTPGINRGYKSLDAEGKMTEVTAACAPTIYRGGLFPADARGDAFICEPSGNLIKRISLTETGGTLTGRNTYNGSEFLTSTDERFRPVNLANGPDGSLYVVDMYHGIIQHRIYVTSYLRKQIESRDLDKGLHGGRIYRIVPDNAPSAATRFAALPNLARTDTAGLVAALASPQGWTRDTAQRLLVEKRDPTAKAALSALAANSPEPLARLHALWTLEGLNALDRDTVEKSLGDVDPRVLAAAIRLSEKFLGWTTDPELQTKVLLAFLAHHEPAVRLQLALTLSGGRTPEAIDAIHQLLQDAGEQPYIVDAIVSGLAGRETEFIEKVARETSTSTKPATRAIMLAASCVFKAGDAAAIDRLLNFINAVRNPAWARLAAVDGLERFIPHNKERKLLMASLPAEPKPLLAVAARAANDPAGAKATDLLPHLKWPGKPGTTTAAIPLTPEQQALFNEGRTNYANICAVCHQPSGQGQSGLAPALVNSRWVQGDPRALARIVLQGRATENLIMPSLKGLDDRMLAGILTYIRQSWGHNSPPIGPEVLVQARKETAGREEPWSETELNEQFPETPAK